MRTVARALFIAFLVLPLWSSAQILPPPPTPPAVPTVNVTDTCTVTDSTGGSHTFGPGQYLGICALAAAKDQGAVSAYTLDNFSFGLFLNSLNGTTPSDTEFWDLFQNGTEASVGLSDLTISSNDLITFQLTDWSTNSTVGAPVSFKIGTLTASAPVVVVSGGGGSMSRHAPFDVANAVYFLGTKEGTNGSFGSLMLDDWAAIMTATGDAGDIRAKLIASFTANPPVLTSITDNERHAMALEALGIDPAVGTGVNYVTPIVAAFDGQQIGDHSFVNDDVFGLIALLHAGYTTQDNIISHSADFIVREQEPNGSWADSVDMTAAAAQALALVPSVPGVPNALAQAKAYLHTQQKSDGGFGNPSSTSWVLQAIRAFGENVFNWDTESHYMPDYYLATQQQTDGGVDSVSTDVSTRVWETIYAIPAVKLATWDSLLHSFQKPAPVVPPSAATTTEAAAPPASTSTSAVAPLTHIGTPTQLNAAIDTTDAAPPVDATGPATSSDTAVIAQTAAAASASIPPVVTYIGFLILLFLALMLGARYMRGDEGDAH